MNTSYSYPCLERELHPAR